MFGKDIFIDREDVKYYALTAGDIIRCFVDTPPEGRPQGVNPEIISKQSGEGGVTNSGYEPAAKRARLNHHGANGGATGFGGGYNANNFNASGSHDSHNTGQDSNNSIDANSKSAMEKQLDNLKMLIQWRDEGKITQEEYNQWHSKLLISSG